MISTILLSYSSSGEAGAAGPIIGILTLLAFWIYNLLKPKAKEIKSNIILNINPNNVKSLVEKGYLEISRKNFSSAVDYFQKALKLSSNSIDALVGVAFAYHLINDYPNSKAAIERYQENAVNGKLDDFSVALMTYLYGHHCYMEENFEQAQNCKENAKTFAILSDDAQEIIQSLNLY